MQAAFYDCMQAVCIPSVAPAYITQNIRYFRAKIERPHFGSGHYRGRKIFCHFFGNRSTTVRSVARKVQQMNMVISVVYTYVQQFTHDLRNSVE